MSGLVGRPQQQVRPRNLGRIPGVVAVGVPCLPVETRGGSALPRVA